ncbi:hypothetical protein FRC0024_02440 [Corynebacterium diphtheriae]|nr:hypothetical protein FRC0024_02440 [Corynebacterium diphtheriae]
MRLDCVTDRRDWAFGGQFVERVFRVLFKITFFFFAQNCVKYCSQSSTVAGRKLVFGITKGFHVYTVDLCTGFEIGVRTTGFSSGAKPLTPWYLLRRWQIRRLVLNSPGF